jgi:hypothetical protein
MNLKAGKFLNAENIAFMDFKHFNGNQTHIGQSARYLNVLIYCLIIPTAPTTVILKRILNTMTKAIS